MTDVLIDLLAEVSHRFQQRLRDEVQAAHIGLTHFEAKALATIARLPGSTQQQVAARLGCDKAQLARAIKVLEVRSLIARKISAADWRAFDLVVTLDGEKVFSAIQSRRSAVAQACLADISDVEREGICSALSNIIARL